MQWRRHAAQLAVGMALVGAGLALAVGVAGTPTSSASAANAAATESLAGRVGVSSHLVWISEGESFPLLQQAATGGVTWIREDFPWRIIEPTRGSFSWTNTDGLMAAASRAGLNVLAIMGQSPAWAASGPNNTYPPTDPADYANYVKAVLLRYGANGTFWASRPELTPRPLSAVELWNEPWGYWAWKPNPDPSGYARLVRAAVPAIRSVRPETTVLISGDYWQVRTDGPARRWLKELLAADPGINGIANAYSVHPYPDPRPMGPLVDSGDPSFTFAGQIRLARETDPSLPIWVTEIGWSTASTADSVSEATQAQYVHDATQRALVDLGVARIFDYMLRDTSGSEREGRYGLLHVDGTPKPAWDSLTTLLNTVAPTTTTAPTATTLPTSTASTSTTTTTTPTTTATTTTTTASTAATTTTRGKGKGKGGGHGNGSNSFNVSLLSLRARVVQASATGFAGWIAYTGRPNPRHLQISGRLRLARTPAHLSLYVRRHRGWRELGARPVAAKGRFLLIASCRTRARVLALKIVVRGPEGTARTRVRRVWVQR